MSRISRRQALKLAALGVVVPALPGCGAVEKAGTAVATAAKVVIKVGFKIGRVVSAVLSVSALVIKIVAMIDGIQQALKAEPTKEQVAQLQNGGKLIIQGSDGNQFEIPFTVES